MSLDVDDKSVDKVLMLAALIVGVVIVVMMRGCGV